MRQRSNRRSRRFSVVRARGEVSFDEIERSSSTSPRYWRHDMSLGTVKVPTIEQFGEVAAELGFTFSPADLTAHLEALAPAFEAYNRLDQMPDELPPVVYPRRPGRRPLPEENPHGAWYVKTEIAGASSGKLAGKL